MEGRGFEKLFNSNTFIIKNYCMNKFIYSQLVISTVEGTEHHLVAQIRNT